MPNNLENINLRSEDVQEILTRVPNWMIRWGNLLILGIIIMIFALTCFISYPDIVSTKIMVTTNVPPEKIVAKTTGRIEVIAVKNHAIVAKNTVLAIIENAANYKDVLLLKKCLEENNTGQNFPFSNFKTAQFGDIESAFSALSR